MEGGCINEEGVEEVDEKGLTKERRRVVQRFFQKKKKIGFVGVFGWLVD